MDIIALTLNAFGLSENEAKVYREIVKEHESNPYALAKACNIPRTTVYEILTSLALKDLIDLKRSDGFTKQQTRILAKDPSYLRTIIRNRRHELAKLDAEVVHILPMLKKDFQPSDPNADFQFFPGIEGAKRIFSESCLDDTEIPEYLFNYKVPDDAFGRDFINNICDTLNKQKRNIVPREILPLSEWTKHCVSYQFERDPKYLEVSNMRYIDQPGFDMKNRISIKGTLVRMLSVDNDEYWGVSIRSMTLSNALAAIFRLLWSTATPITPTVVASWGANEYLAAENGLAKERKSNE